MKALGMFFIIWGHLSPAHLKDVIYAFNVPCFFIISGFLFKDTYWSTFWKKNIKGLVVPYALLCATVIAFFAAVKLYFGGMGVTYLPLSILACLIGDQNGIGCGVGCQALWFVYTLFLIRVVANAVKDRWPLQCIIIVFCLIMASSLKKYNIQLFSSYIDFLLAYPFFVIGYYMAKSKILKVDQVQACISNKRYKALCIVLLLLSIIALFCIAHYNGMVRMYNANYGNNLILFLLGGCIGTAFLAFISVLLGTLYFPKKSNRESRLETIISIHSKGSIITLAWQIIFLFGIDLCAKNLIGESLHNDVISLIAALCIYSVFIPIIKFVNNYMPIVSGYRE